MAKKAVTGASPSIGDEAVLARTGKDWAERMKSYWKRNLESLKQLLES